MKRVCLPDGQRVPALGQGTWRMGESKRARKEEIAALRLGIELGMTLIDTAEMYGDGGAEELVGEAVAGQREHVFVVTKVYPHNASAAKLPRACERSLRRLRTNVVDLYLLHWREKTPPLAETVEAFQQLRAAGKIRHWGVSNFDLADMQELLEIKNGGLCATNQVLYNLENRQIEFDLLPWSDEKGIPIMAYAPVGHGRGLLDKPTLQEIAGRHQASPAQIALAWLFRCQNVIAIPKAADQAHVRENAASVDIKLSDEDLALIDQEFPPPRSKHPLPML